jgi:hypothetical protein
MGVLCVGTCVNTARRSVCQSFRAITTARDLSTCSILRHPVVLPDMEEGGTYLEDFLLSLELLPNDMRRDFELV